MRTIESLTFTIGGPYIYLSPGLVPNCYKLTVNRRNLYFIELASFTNKKNKRICKNASLNPLVTRKMAAAGEEKRRLAEGLKVKIFVNSHVGRNLWNDVFSQVGTCTIYEWLDDSGFPDGVLSTFGGDNSDH